MALYYCGRCTFPATSLTGTGLCHRCWKGPPLEMHGPETLAEYERRTKREARQEERRALRLEEKRREHAAEVIRSYRVTISYTQRAIHAAEAMDERGEDSSEAWAEAASGVAQCVRKAIRAAESVAPSHRRMWLNRAASCADVGAECMHDAAVELRRMLSTSKGSAGLQVVSGRGEASSKARPVLLLLAKGDAP